MKIAVIGAGQGALVFAARAAEGGADVTVFEKRNSASLAYDWHDDVNARVFDRLKIPNVDENYRFTKKNWSFVPPMSDLNIKIDQNKEDLDQSTQRRILTETLVDYAKSKGAKFEFMCEVDSLIVKDEAVKGIKVGGEEIYCDLCVDCSGVYSKFRAQVPAKFKVDRTPEKDEVFMVRRTFFKGREGVERPIIHTNKVYLKHLGEAGISWCIYDDSSDVADVLIGRVGALDDCAFERAMEHIKKENPIVGDEAVKGGVLCVIPVRYPLTHMVGDGYAAIGDAAFMTIPMLGSGMELSFYAGAILADVVLESGKTTAEALWKYEREYIARHGAVHFGVDILKRWLLTAQSEDIRFLMEKGVVAEEEMKPLCVGRLIKLSPSDMAVKLLKGFRKLPVLLALNNLLIKAQKAVKIAKKIPLTYDTDEIDKWNQKLRRLVIGR